MTAGELRVAQYEDYKQWLLATPANPPTPYMLRPGLRGCLGVPDGLTVEEMERYAADYGKRYGTPVCLVINKRICVRFAANGSLTDIVEAQPPENPREELT